MGGGEGGTGGRRLRRGTGLPPRPRRPFRARSAAAALSAASARGSGAPETLLRPRAGPGGDGGSSEILRGIFTGMLEGACRTCIDPFFPPPDGYDASDIEDVEGSDLWDKVYPPDKEKGPPPQPA